MKYSAVSFPPCAMSLVTPMTADEKARASGILAGGISGDLWCVLELGLCLWGDVSCLEDSYRYHLALRE